MLHISYCVKSHLWLKCKTEVKSGSLAGEKSEKPTISPVATFINRYILLYSLFMVSGFIFSSMLQAYNTYIFLPQIRTSAVFNPKYKIILSSSL